MNSGKLNSWRKNKQKQKTTNPQLWDPPGKKFETPRCKKITWKQDFETYQKYFWDFKIKPKFSETNIFLTYHSIPLRRLSFIRGLNFGGVGGGAFGRFVLRFATKDKNHVSCYRLANPKGSSGSLTKSCEILLLLIETPGDHNSNSRYFS